MHSVIQTHVDEIHERVAFFPGEILVGHSLCTPISLKCQKPHSISHLSHVLLISVWCTLNWNSRDNWHKSVSDFYSTMARLCGYSSEKLHYVSINLYFCQLSAVLLFQQ
jgi:predicted alpha/beta hydrolase family esterase